MCSSICTKILLETPCKGDRPCFSEKPHAINTSHGLQAASKVEVCRTFSNLGTCQVRLKRWWWRATYLDDRDGVSMLVLQASPQATTNAYLSHFQNVCTTSAFWLSWVPVQVLRLENRIPGEGGIINKSRSLVLKMKVTVILSEK